MNRRSYATMALMAGLGILAAGVVVIASRSRQATHSESSAFDAVRAFTDLMRLRMDGSDSGQKRRALKAAAGKLPDSPLAKALGAYGAGDLEAAAREPASTPFAKCSRGWILFELGRRPEAIAELKRGLEEARPDWEFRPLFEEALRKMS